jgi:hypothetical protein
MNQVPELINILLFVFAIMGTNLIDLLNLHIGQTEKIGASIVLIALYLFVARLKKSEKVYSLTEKTKEYVRFFEEWYSRPGELTIFCNDLEWLEWPEHAGILQTLKLRGKKLSLYAREIDTDNEIARQLRESKATIIKTESVQTKHRFSLLEHDDVVSIIIRKRKDPKSEDIVFVETDNYLDPYLISLARDVLTLAKSET